MTDTHASGFTPEGNGSFSDNPMPNGASSQVQGKVKPEDLLTLTVGDESVTSSFTIVRLFSLRKKKFLRPFRSEVYGLVYKVLPGTYLKIVSGVHKYKDTRMEWDVKIIRVSRNEKGEADVEVVREAHWITPIPQEQRSVPILRDIANPSFHDHSRVPYDYEYSEEDVATLLEGGVDPALEGEME